MGFVADTSETKAESFYLELELLLNLAIVLVHLQAENIQSEIELRLSFIRTKLHICVKTLSLLWMLAE